MGKVYNNGLPVGTGLRIDNASPPDDSMYYETFEDLATIEYKYDGKVARVQDENFKAYIYRENTNTWIADSATNSTDKFTSVGQVFVEDNEYTFTDNNGTNYTWNTNGNAYANTETIITIPYASPGKKRIQMFYVDDSNGIKTRAGLEVNVEEQALSPELNPFEIQLALIFVTDSTTGIPAPISTEDFVKRAHSEQVQVAVTDGLINASAATGGQTHFIITQPNVDIRGFVGSFANADLDHNFYQGKLIIIDNRSGQPINLVHLSNTSPFADARLSLPNAQNISVPHGGVVQFKYDEFSDSSCAMIAASFFVDQLIPITPIAGTITATPNMNGKSLRLVVGDDPCIFIVAVPLRCDFMKIGEGHIDFMQGSGRTLIGRNSTLKMQSNYSIGFLDFHNTIDLFFVNDNYNLNFLSIDNTRAGFIDAGTFNATPAGENKRATVIFSIPFPDANYFPDAVFQESRPGWHVTDITNTGFTIQTNSISNMVNTVRWKAIRFEL